VPDLNGKVGDALKGGTKILEKEVSVKTASAIYGSGGFLAGAKNGG